MDTKILSNIELLELIMGKHAARQTDGSRLCDLFRDDSGYQLLHAARELVERMLIEDMATGVAITSPATISEYLKLHFRLHESEAFVVVFLDTRLRLIRSIEMFRGTLAAATVYPREVVREAIKQNAAAVIVAHNHPSGIAEPSHADRELTEHLRSALTLIDVRVIDHIIVAGMETVSFAERGWC